MVMYALIAGFRSAMRSRQFWVAVSAVASPARIARASSAIVCALADIRWRRGANRLARGVEIPVGAAKSRCRSGQRFEERAKAGKIAAIGVLDGRIEPGLDRHPKVITYLCFETDEDHRDHRSRFGEWGRHSRAGGRRRGCLPPELFARHARVAR